MGRPKGNGLIELVDEKSKDRGFFCMQLVGYLIEERDIGTPEYGELWDIRFEQAKNHQCAYKDKCPVYAKTIAKKSHTPIQLQLNFH